MIIIHTQRSPQLLMFLIWIFLIWVLLLQACNEINLTWIESGETYFLLSLSELLIFKGPTWIIVTHVFLSHSQCICKC